MVNQSRPVVALFGGSFDPPHKGHQRIVQSAIKNLAIDKLIVVPAFLNPFKHTSFASADKRLQWTSTLFETLDKVMVNDYEITEERSVPSADTVKHFSTQYEVRYLIIGADNLSSLHRWHEFGWLNQTIVWVIFTRENYQLEVSHLREYKILTLNENVSSSQIRDEHLFDHIDNKIKTSVKDILKGSSQMTIEERVEYIVAQLDEKKADEIEVFDLQNADYIAKRVIIANSLNGKHTIALFEHIKKALKERNDDFLASDASDDWAVADLGDILLHIMVPEYRQRYSLEQFLSELVENQKKNKDIDPA